MDTVSIKNMLSADKIRLLNALSVSKKVRILAVVAIFLLIYLVCIWFFDATCLNLYSSLIFPEISGSPYYIKRVWPLPGSNIRAACYAKSLSRLMNSGIQVDVETGSFLPYLIPDVGDNQDASFDKLVSLSIDGVQQPFVRAGCFGSAYLLDGVCSYKGFEWRSELAVGTHIAKIAIDPKLSGKTFEYEWQFRIKSDYLFIWLSVFLILLVVGFVIFLRL
jgi:hypothetical protein